MKTMKSKIWYTVKVNGEVVAKIKTQGLAYLIFQRMQEIYKFPAFSVEME